MNSKKVLIVDDEKIARDRISRLLQELDRNLVLREASNGLTALEAIAEFKPDIVFLDVEMPGLNGFEVLQQLETRDFQIIFQTAYDEYAVKAFEESACDYLLKPFSKDRLEKAFAKAALLQGQADSFEKLTAQQKKDSKFLDKITYKLAGKIKVLPIEQISYFLSQDHCTCAFDLSGQEHIIDFSIQYLEAQLNPNEFVRCHRNSMVRLKHIQALGSSTEANVILSSGIKLPVSRAQRPKILAKLG